MCARRGKSLSQGVVIITGSIVAPKFVRADDSVRAVVEGLGEVLVRVA
jgi:2-keto-4-pentenoate hydratase